VLPLATESHVLACIAIKSAKAAVAKSNPGLISWTNNDKVTQRSQQKKSMKQNYFQNNDPFEAI
jgi:ribosomal protein L24E